MVRNANNGTLRAISGDAVGDENHVDGLKSAVVGIAARGNGLLVGTEVGLHDLVNACAGGCAVRAHLVEENLNLFGATDILPAAEGVLRGGVLSV